MTQRTFNDLVKELQLDTIYALSHMDGWDEEDFESYVNHREKIVSEMDVSNDGVNEEAKNMIREILENDVLILRRMEFLKQEASRNLRHLGEAKMQQRGYQNKYTLDSLFIDKRN